MPKVSRLFFDPDLGKFEIEDADEIRVESTLAECKRKWEQAVFQPGEYVIGCNAPFRKLAIEHKFDVDAAIEAHKDELAAQAAAEFGLILPGDLN